MIAPHLRTITAAASNRRQTLLAGIAGAALVCAAPFFAALPAAAYTPSVFNSKTDIGQDFTTVPANTSAFASNGINRSVFSNVWGSHFYFGGASGLWITSSASQGWPSSGMMQTPSSCAAGFGYGDFHWRSAEGQANAGPGANEIMWPADNDAAWPGIIKNSDDNHIGEVDVNEVNYGSNGTLYSTFHFYNGSASGHNGSIMHNPITYPVGDMTAMHDFDIVWGAASLVLKVDGVVQISAPPTQVRADYAHGGCNYTLGAQMAMQATGYDKTPDDWIMLAGMWWSPTDQSAGSGTSTPIGAPAPPPPPPPPAPTPTPVSKGLTVTSASFSSNAIAVTWSKATGSRATVRWRLDGGYQGVVEDGAADGSSMAMKLGLNAKSLAAMRSGSTHSVQLYIDGGASSNVMALTVGGAASPAPIPVPLPVAPPPAPVTSGHVLTITSPSYSNGTLQALVTQTVAGGIRFLIDGKYAGVERDSAPVGTQRMVATFSKPLSAGTHTVTYYINNEQSTTAATASFTVS